MECSLVNETEMGRTADDLACAVVVLPALLRPFQAAVDRAGGALYVALSAKAFRPCALQYQAETRKAFSARPASSGSRAAAVRGAAAPFT